MVNIQLLYKEDSNQNILLLTWGLRHYEKDAPYVGLTKTSDSSNEKTWIK